MRDTDVVEEVADTLERDVRLDQVRDDVKSGADIDTQHIEH